MAEKNISLNKYGELKTFISNNSTENNWIPLTSNISVEYTPNLVIRISNILWEFNEKAYTDEVKFTINVMKYNNDNNRFFESEMIVNPFEIPNNHCILNIVKYNDKKEYERNSSIIIDLPEEYIGKIDAFEFLYTLQNMLIENDEFKNLIGKNAIFSGLIENCPGNFDLVIDSSKKSPLDKIKDGFKKSLKNGDVYELEYKHDIKYITGDIRGYVEKNPKADIMPLSERIAVLDSSKVNWKLLNFEWIFDPEIDIKSPVEMIDAIDYFNNKFNPEICYYDFAIEDLSTPNEILILQTTEWIDEPPFIDENLIFLNVPDYKEMDYKINAIDLVYVLQNLIRKPEEDKLDFKDHNYLLGIIEEVHGYCHLILDAPYQEITKEDRLKMIEYFKKEGVINE